MFALKTICSPFRLLIPAILAVGAAGPANAAYYTNHEAALDSIFSQASFGASTVDIRFLSLVTLTSNLASITAEEDFDGLEALGVPSPSVSMFFVDVVDFCGSYDVSIDGCGQTPGHVLAFESEVGAGVVGHELGHNLGLSHDNTSPMNIMNANSGPSDLFFTSEQVAMILASELVQTDDSTQQRFINIQPYVLDAPVPVPLPASSLLLCLGLGFLAVIGIRKKGDFQGLFA